MPRLARLLLALPLALALPGCGLFNEPDLPDDCLAGDEDCDGAVGSEDCDDSNPAVSPTANERCNEIDDNCDGVIDEGFDEDADGVLTCRGDCDDADPTTYLGAEDLCGDAVDNDCDGVADNGPDQDLDDDGACGSVDCDDADPLSYPGAPEVCDNRDNDCDEELDEGYDQDGDGYTICAGDCDDDEPSTFPGAIEVCDGVDQDCNGVEDLPIEDFDEDEDGALVCADGDCDDDDDTIFVGAFEIADGRDEDCDGVIDDGWDGTGPADRFAPTYGPAVVQGGLGLVVSTVGDLNGDGYPDFAAGAPTWSFSKGRAYIWLGSPFDLADAPPFRAPDITVSGETDGKGLGQGVALVDLDGDGFDDFVVGTPDAGPGSTPQGQVRIYWGSATPTLGAWDEDDFDRMIVGSLSVERCGTTLADAGDLNNDGKDDLAIGCPWFATNDGIVGRTAVIMGRSRTAWSTVNEVSDGDLFVAGVGGEDNYSSATIVGDFDMNGDGFSDLAIGSEQYNTFSGRVGVFFGSASLSGFYEIDEGDRVWSGAPLEEVGAFLAAGDLNGDGKDELLIGAPKWDGQKGRLAIVSGASNVVASGALWTQVTMTVDGDIAGGLLGTSAAVVELSGDSAADLVVGSPGWDGPEGGDQGRISLFLGPVTAGARTPANAPATIVGADGGDALGISVIAIGDASGDGQDDLLISAPYNDDAANGAGQIYFVPGFP